MHAGESNPVVAAGSVHRARLPLGWHEAHHSADMKQRAKQASMALSNFAQSQFLYLQNFVNVVGALVALSLMSLWTVVYSGAHDAMPTPGAGAASHTVH